jgi:hypothetical protein
VLECRPATLSFRNESQLSLSRASKTCSWNIAGFQLVNILGFSPIFPENSSFFHQSSDRLHYNYLLGRIEMNSGCFQGRNWLIVAKIKGEWEGCHCTSGDQAILLANSLCEDYSISARDVIVFTPNRMPMYLSGIQFN